MHERATYGDALLHSAGKLDRISILESGEADELEQPGGVLPMRRPHLALNDLDGEKDVLQDGAPLEQDGRLERNPNVLDGLGDRLAMQQNLPGRRPQNAAGKIDEGALPAAAWAHQRHELAVGDGEVEILDGRERLFAGGKIGLGKELNFEQGLPHVGSKLGSKC